jgi:hypothetical protein
MTRRDVRTVDELEERLTEWGREWRDGQPPIVPGTFDPLPNARDHTFRGYFSAILGIAVIGAVVLGWVGVTAFIRSDVGDGGLIAGSGVTASGWLIASTDGRQVQLCLGGFGRLMGPPTCSVVAVRVEGVQWDAVPGATQEGGVWYAADVTVRGTWTGSTVTVKSVIAAPSSSSLPAIPASCQSDLTKSGGRPSPNSEAALKPLDSEVLDNPNRYAGLWRAASTEGLGPMVVEVVGDPSAAEKKLREIYPYPLCLVTAKFSETKLNSTLNLLGRATKEWLAEVDYPSNRVVVSVSVLTDSVRGRLQPYLDRILVTPLVHPS